VFKSALTGEGMKYENIQTAVCGGKPGVMCQYIPSTISKSKKRSIMGAMNSLDGSVNTMTTANIVLTVLLGASLSELWGMIRPL
jgi:hypothetical protein